MSKKCVTLTDLGLSTDKAVKIIGRHKIICRLSSETKIYRYMRFEVLQNILSESVLHISNRQDFSDLRETKGLEKDIDPITSFNFIPNYRSRQRQATMKRKALPVCVSCWTLDKRLNNKIDESFLMWKAYSIDNYTCRVGTTIEQLVKSIKKTPADIVISDVYYTNEPKNEYENLLFRKSLYYSDEQEVRMVVLSNDERGVDLTIDSQELLSEIKLSPFVSPEKGIPILKELRELCKGYKEIKIERSNIMEYEETKEKS